MKISSREQALLNALEVIRRKKERITIIEFAKRSGYSHRSALQRYPTLRKALHDYCVVEAGRRHLPAPRADLVERAAQERESRAQTRELARLRARLAAAEGQIAEHVVAVADRETLVQERDALRGIVSALVAQIAQRSVVRAQDIERDILAVAGQFVEGLPPVPAAEAPAKKPAKSVAKTKTKAKAAPTRTPLRLERGEA